MDQKEEEAGPCDELACLGESFIWYREWPWECCWTLWEEAKLSQWQENKISLNDLAKVGIKFQC